MSEETGRMEYRLVKGTHGRFENGAFVQYGLNSKIALTDREAEALKGRIELTSSSVGAAATDTDAGDTGSDAEWSFLDDLHHVKAVEFVRGLDDPEQVQSALDYELSHKNRPSVTFAAKDRIKEIGALNGGGDTGEDEG